MKRIIVILLQTVLLLVVFFAGGILPVFHLLPLWSVSTGASSMMVLDGFVLLIILYMLLVLFALLRRRLIHGGINATVAFVLALAIGLILKFPFRSI